MRVIVTGGAGFIGSHLVELLSKENHVIVFDNLSSGSLKNIESLKDSKNVEFFKKDCTSYDELVSNCKNVDLIFHFAANPEVRLENATPDSSFKQNIFSTKIMLDIAKENKIKKFVFASTSTIYGEAELIPTPENYGPLKPISIYGATKLSSEALVMAYCSSFNMDGIILRFANIIGKRSNHGVIIDFINKLKNNSNELIILGDGTQTKSYLHITDCISAILLASKQNGIKIFNVGSEDEINVIDIAKIISMKMKILPKIKFEDRLGEGRGWTGDVKKMVLDISEIKKIGFNPKMNSMEAVTKSISEVLLK